MATKRKIERSFNATKRYNEYMRKYMKERYAAQRAEAGKSYTPRTTEEPAPKEPSADALAVLQRAITGAPAPKQPSAETIEAIKLAIASKLKK